MRFLSILAFCALACWADDCMVFWDPVHNGVVARCEHVPRDPNILRRNLVYLKMALADCIPPEIGRDFIRNVKSLNPRLSDSEIIIPLCSEEIQHTAPSVITAPVVTTTTNPVLQDRGIEPGEITREITKETNNGTQSILDNCTEGEKTANIALLKKLKMSNSSLFAHNLELKQKNFMLNSTIYDCERELFTGKKEIQEVKNLLDYWKLNAQTAEIKITELRENFSQCLAQNNELWANLSHFYPLYKALLKEQSNWSVNISQCMQRISTSHKENSENSRVYLEMQELVKSLTDQTHSLENNNKELLLNISSCLQQNSNLSRDFAEIHASYNQQKMRCTNLETNLTTCQYSNLNLKNLKVISSTELKDIKIQTEKLQMNLTHCVNEMDFYIKNSTLNISACLQQNSDLSLHFSEIRASYNQQKMRCTNLETNLTTCQYSNLNLKKLKNILTTDLKDLKIQTERWQINLTDCFNEMDFYIKNSTHLYHAYHYLNSKNHALIKNITNLTTKIMKMKIENTNLDSLLSDATQLNEIQLKNCKNTHKISSQQLYECLNNVTISTNLFLEESKKNNAIFLEMANETNDYKNNLAIMQINLENSQNELYQSKITVQNLTYLLQLMETQNENLSKELECTAIQKKFYMNNSDIWELKFRSLKSSMTKNASYNFLIENKKLWFGTFKIELNWENLPDLCIRTIGFLWVLGSIIFGPIVKLFDQQLQATSLDNSFIQKSFHMLSESSLSQMISNSIYFLLAKLVNLVITKCCKRRPLFVNGENTHSCINFEDSEMQNDIFDETEMHNLSPIFPTASPIAGPSHSTPG